MDSIALPHEAPFEPATPMIIDSFAGGGGASTGIEMALGRSPDVAINHSGPALALHQANHPETLHLNSNIWDADPLSVTGGRPVGLLWASPDCKHFSKAKGAALCDRNIRDLAWVVVRWAEEARPDVICMENVEEFVTWGPVGEDGRPIREFAGMTYELWVKRLRKAGYKVKWRELRACDYGAPTIRKRWFCVARRDGRPIVWPAPTHGDPASPAVRKGRLQPWRSAADCIDWSLPCPSIFDSSAEIMARHGLRAVRPLAKNTLARIARGMRRYVLDAERPFIVNLTHGARTEDLAQPLRTITGANRGEKALVAPSLTRFNGGATGADLRDPMPTVTANSWIKRPGGAMPLGIVTPHLLSLKGSARRDGAVSAPHPTVLAGGGHSAVVAPILTYAQQGGGNRSAEDPHHTICASKKDQNSLLAATMVHVGNGERPGQAPRALDIGAPLNTVVAGGVKHYPVAAFLAQQNTGHVGRDAREPMSTILKEGSHQTPVAAWFAKYYGTGDGARMDAPCHTVTVKDRLGHMQADLAAPPFAPEHEARAREVAEFLRAHGAWDGGAFVTLEVDGQSFVVIDIGMRMLSPRELFNAQGFPPDYVIEGAWEGLDSDDPTFRPFSKDVQISCCGNSVCPPVAAAIIAANCPHLAASRQEQEAHDAV
ncbi:DNA cytosine methyltransferase [Rhodovulum sulfidophilum]|uniref:DNA (cytosine-5-)-methyltransferase n=2 Tax=Rhodovulum sulfidophilum TaxID=35806 RepID=A0ABS1RSE5_RHOSU|nr:DNA cytosine methyltransferase [Rhodovulum sulfidophilum]